VIVHFALGISARYCQKASYTRRAQKSPDLQLSAAEHLTLHGVVFRKKFKLTFPP
jgi:hypothetical protein